MLSTGAMALTGRVYEGQMIGMQASNAKLRDRAVRMLTELTGHDRSECEAHLEACGYDIRAALLVAETGASPDEARAKLEQANGSVRTVLAATV